MSGVNRTNRARAKKVGFILNVLYVAAVVLVAYIVFRCLHLVLPFVLAFAIVSITQSLVSKLYQKWKWNKKLVTVLFLLLLYGIAGGLITWLVFQLIYLLKNLFTEFPVYFDAYIFPFFRNISETIQHAFSNFSLSMPTELASVWDSVITGIQGAVVSISQNGISWVTGIINNLPAFFISLVFTILLSFFIGIQYDKVLIFLKVQIPQKIQSKLTGMRSLLKNTVFRYVKAILILMVITFVELCIGFLILGIDNPFGKAAGIALFDALPVFGTGGIMIPWVIIILLEGNYGLAAGVAILYGIVTLIRNLIEPKIIGDQLGINPVVSILSIYIGYRLLGVIGMIVFPMLAQVLLVLHKNGRISLYKEEHHEQYNE